MSPFLFEDIFSIFGTLDLFEKWPWEMEALFSEFSQQWLSQFSVGNSREGNRWKLNVKKKVKKKTRKWYFKAWNCTPNVRQQICILLVVERNNYLNLSEAKQEQEIF